MAVTMEQVVNEWKEDCKIEETKLTRELVTTPSLHAKYLDYFIYFKAKLASSEKKMNLLAWKKRKFFRGEMEKHELQQHGWSQWNGLKPSGSELNQLLEMDNDMNDAKEVVAAYKTAITACEYILKQLQQRDWAIKSIIDHQKYLSGS